MSVLIRMKRAAMRERRLQPNGPVAGLWSISIGDFGLTGSAWIGPRVGGEDSEARGRASAASGIQQQLVFDLHQFPDFLEALVESSPGNMMVDGVDAVAGSRNGLAQLLEEARIRSPVSRNVVLQIHHLDAVIEPLDRGSGGLRGHGVLLAEDWRLAVDQEGSAGAGIDDDGFADDDSLKRLQLDPQRHDRLLF